MEHLNVLKTNIIRKGWKWWAWRVVWVAVLNQMTIYYLVDPSLISILWFLFVAAGFVANVANAILGKAESSVPKEFTRHIGNVEAASVFTVFFLFQAWLVSRVNLSETEISDTQLELNDFSIFFLLSAAVSALFATVYLIQDRLSKFKQQKSLNSDHL